MLIASFTISCFTLWNKLSGSGYSTCSSKRRTPASLLISNSEASSAGKRERKSKISSIFPRKVLSSSGVRCNFESLARCWSCVESSLIRYSHKTKELYLKDTIFSIKYKQKKSDFYEIFFPTQKIKYQKAEKKFINIKRLFLRF